MGAELILSDRDLDMTDLGKVFDNDVQIKLDESTYIQIDRCRDYLEKAIIDDDSALYGINTGFGSLCNIRIGDDELVKLQHNLVKSHACGTGPTIPKEIARIVLFLKIRSLSLGFSGIRRVLIDRLISWFNHGDSRKPCSISTRRCDRRY